MLVKKPEFAESVYSVGCRFYIKNTSDGFLKVFEIFLLSEMSGPAVGLSQTYINRLWKDFTLAVKRPRRKAVHLSRLMPK